MFVDFANFRHRHVAVPLMLLILIQVKSSYAAENKTQRWRYPQEVHRLVKEKFRNSSRLPPNGRWSEWSTWTPCSRSCGAGVASQTRQCLRNTRRSVNESEASTSNYRFRSTAESKGCMGPEKRYHICNTQACPDGSKDFRLEQCESFNPIPFMGRFYAWEPHVEASSNPCELNCRASGFRFFALLNKTVVDGTLCRPRQSDRICVQGSCMVVGCDGIVGSEKRWDACGVCGGDNSTCQIISGIFTEPHLPHGYNLIAQIPKGACHINITVLKPTRNYLALRRSSDSSFIVNGNWDINWSGDYQGAGSTFTYTRQEASAPEFISSQGPLTEPVDIMVVAYQVNPGIKYEYMIPLGASTPVLPGQPNAGTNLAPPWPRPALPAPVSTNPLGAFPGRPSITPGSSSSYPSLSSSGGLAHFGIVPQFADGSTTSPAEKPPPAPNDGRLPSQKRTQRPRIIGDRQKPHERFAGPRSSPDVQGTDPNTATLNGVNNRRSRRGKFVWKQSGFSECSKSCGSGTQTTQVVCVKEDTATPVPERRCRQDEKPAPETVRCNTKPCPAEWVASDWSACSVTCGEGVQTRDLACKQEISATLTMKVTQAACLSPPPAIQKRRTCQLAPCTRWHVSEWSTCSADCGKGLRHRKVYCGTDDSREVAESQCRDVAKPEEREVCDMGSCSRNTWFFTEWTGHCSEECGSGIQSRQVYCAASDDNGCDIGNKPDATRTCVSSKDCAGKWFAGPWSHCSSTCNEGFQTRDVLCLTFVRGQYRVGLDTQCLSAEKPETRRTCNSGPCRPQWYMTDWSECSVTCGTGAERREVKCLDGNQRPSQDCVEETRPLQRQPCHSTPCSLHAPQVLADEHSLAKESQEDTPVETTTTPAVGLDWPGQVSRGAIKKGSRGKNASKLATTSSSETLGDSCVDKFKNCHLVVQARLCRLKYYRVSCCSSCAKHKDVKN